MIIAIVNVLLLQIYDFACNALEYCLNREPVMFRNTRFVVDRFHYKYNHKCSELFKMDRYQQLDGVNSSFMESVNSFIYAFRPQLSQMGQHSYMNYLRATLLIRNKSRNEKLKEEAAWGVGVQQY